MKVPPTPAPEKAPAYEKDRTITRRSVAGAAGGMRGVDYEDDRRPGIGEGPAEGEGGLEARRADPRDPKGAGTLNTAEDSGKRGPLELDPSKLQREDESAAADPARRKKKRAVVRDRLTVDKDAPEIRRKKKRQEEDEDQEQAADDAGAEQVFSFDADALEAGGARVSRAHLFDRSTPPQPGELDLLYPDDIHHALETPLNYAKHCVILSEAFRRSTGATREEAIAYLGRMFVGPSDPAFGRLALKEFGPSTGIVDVYPLEVQLHVLEKYPGFLPKVGMGRFFSKDGERATHYQTDTLRPVILEYPEELKIRGFALIGGGNPGYLFEPAEAPGTYRLQFHAPGNFACAVSALAKTGHTMIERFTVAVSRAAQDTRSAPAPSASYPARDGRKVAAWPMPRALRFDPTDALLVDVRPSGEKSALMSKEDVHRGRAADLDFRKERADGKPTLEPPPPSAPRASTAPMPRAPTTPPPPRAPTPAPPQRPARASVVPGARGPAEASPIRSASVAPTTPAEPAISKGALKELGAKILGEVTSPLVARPGFGTTPPPELSPAPLVSRAPVFSVLPRAPLFDDAETSEPEAPEPPPPTGRARPEPEVIEVEGRLHETRLPAPPPLELTERLVVPSSEPETARIDTRALVADLALTMPELSLPSPRKVETEEVEVEEDPTEIR